MVNLFNIIKENISFMKTGFLIAFLCIAYLLIIPTFAYIGPVAYLTERVYANYNTNGTINSSAGSGVCTSGGVYNPCRVGYVQVALPNTDDTLQTIRVNLSSVYLNETDLISNEAYKAVASSHSSVWDKTTLNVDSSIFGEGNYFNITNTSISIIKFNVTSYSNEQGGKDIYDYDNIASCGKTNNMSITINASNPSATALSGVTITVRFDLNSTSGGNDAVNITYSSDGSISDSDSDGYYDTVIWSGVNLPASGGSAAITLNMDITEIENFDEGTNSLNLDGNTYSDKGVKGDYYSFSSTSALTGMTIDYAYSRGPIRQGIDMFRSGSGNTWAIRGFIQVLANTDNAGETNLTYNISSWALYNASAYNISSGDIKQSGTFSPTNFTSAYGRLYTTDSLSSNGSRYEWNGDKPYLASSFDWYVHWNDTYRYYISYINTTLDLPTLYKVDMTLYKSIDGYLVPSSVSKYNVTDKVQYQGDNNAPVSQITILSDVPNSTTTGGVRTYLNASNARVYFDNGTRTDLTGNAPVSIVITQPDGNSPGLVNLTITDLSQTSAGKNLSQGENITLIYDVTTGNDLEMGDAFNSTGNATITSESGTPLTENFTAPQISTSGRSLLGYKDLWVPSSVHPTLVNGTLVVLVDGGEISGIKFVDYVPLGTNFTCSTNSISFYNTSDSGSTWVSDTNITATDKGNVTLPNGVTVQACEYSSNGGNGWNLTDNEGVKVIYLINITNSGLYEMPMEIAGFDPELGREVRSRALGVVRIKVPSPMIKPTITQTDFLTARTITIGKQVSWVKDFEVYNPNSRIVEAEMEIEVFKDTTDGFVEYLDDEGNEHKEEIVIRNKDGNTCRSDGVPLGGRVMTWKARLAPLETRSYDIKVLTPPILETDRDVEVLRKLEDKMVELRMSIFLRSLADEVYKNVAIHLPISRDNILEVKDSFGNVFSYTGGKGSTTIYIDKFGAKELKEIIIRYKQGYPKIIITPDKDRYSLDATVNLDILVIHGGDEIAYPYLETEIYTPNRDLVYSNIQDLKRLEAIDKTSISESFKVPVGAPTGKYVAETRLRSDLATLATGTGNFYIMGATTGYGNLLGYLVLFFAIAILYFSLKRLYIIKKSQTK